MTRNKETVSRYMDGFRHSDRNQILSCLAEDVVWKVPGAFEVEGKAAFSKHIVADGFVEKPEITISRLTQEGNIVIAEGSVRTQRTDGTMLELAFCDVFEMRNGEIASLTSYLVTLR